MQINNFFNNPNIKCVEQMGAFQIIEHQADLSLSPAEAITAYYSTKMNVKKRQALYNLNGQNSVIMSAGAMQWMAGPISCNTNIKGAGDLVGKMFAGNATGESAVKPVYSGQGIISLEPTYKHLLLTNIGEEWGGGIVMDDGLFLAADGHLQQKIFRKNFSSAITSGMDFFNMSLYGQGIVLLESPVAREEIVEIVLNNETLTVDGDLVIAWSPSIKLTVRPIIKNKGIRGALSSSASGEGLVNVFEGSGKILLAPTL